MRPSISFVYPLAASIVACTKASTLEGPESQAGTVFAQEPFKLRKLEDGFLLEKSGDTLKSEICAANVVHVMFSRDTSFFSRQSLVTNPGAAWVQTSNSGEGE